MAAAKYAELDATVRFDVVEAPDYRGEALHLAPRPETALVVWLHSTMMVVWDVEPGYVPHPHRRRLARAGDGRARARRPAARPESAAARHDRRFLGDRMRPAELMPLLFDSEQFPAQRRPRDDGADPRALLRPARGPQEPELALHAVAAARAQGLDVQVTMVGRNNANYRERVIAPLEAHLGLPDVTYVPHTDLDGCARCSPRPTSSILPSRFDNSPMTIFEALSSGVPVITSDRVGTASWIEPENGLLALPIDDPAEFGARRLPRSPIPSGWPAATGPPRRIRERFAPEVVTGRLLDCYGRLMAERGVHARRELVEEIEATPEEIADTARRLAEIVAEPPSHRIEGARTRAVLAFADELVADPSLLAAWSAAFDGSDDVTLVIYAPDWSRSARATSLGPAVARAGLDSDDAARPARAGHSRHRRARGLAGPRRERCAHRPRPAAAFAALARVDAGVGVAAGAEHLRRLDHGSAVSSDVVQAAPVAWSPSPRGRATRRSQPALRRRCSVALARAASRRRAGQVAGSAMTRRSQRSSLSAGSDSTRAIEPAEVDAVGGEDGQGEVVAGQ